MPNTATPEQAAATVRERVAAGADFVKSAAMTKERLSASSTTFLCARIGSSDLLGDLSTNHLAITWQSPGNHLGRRILPVLISQLLSRAVADRGVRWIGGRFTGHALSGFWLLTSRFRP
ncbi:hypothetical protein [Streptomyces sp. NPDC021356]|uniref:hypothetical protein n=1 Tax=Streptomyces sp. NPDC021356 TaxID=3154900 RepID=UPI0033F19A55